MTLPVNFFLNDKEITSSNGERLLGITLENKLNFKPNITSLYEKAGQYLSAIASIITSKNLATKLHWKISNKSLSTDLDAYFSIIK